MSSGVTLDTGALIALERREVKMQRVVASAAARGMKLVVPWAVVAEWWRGRTDVRERILAATQIELPDLGLARAAGEALARVGPGPSVVDAIVMASAARSGNVVVYTSDLDDLERLRAVFPSVRLFRT